MQARTIAPFLALLTAAGCAQPAPAAPSAPGSRAASAIPNEALDSAVAALFALDMAPGMAVVVVRGEDVIYLRGFGHADVEAGRRVTPETVFYIASTTKAFTGLAAAILDQRSEFDIDAPLSRYLPDARLQPPLSADSITIRSLLAHTHGIANGGPIVWRTAFTGELSGNRRLVALLAEHAPASTGRAFAYGNLGYNVASLAMDRALGRSWKDVLDQEIFRPLGMSSTTGYVSRIPEHRLAMPYRAEPDRFDRIHYGKTDANMHAAGGLVTSAADLAPWLEAQLNAGRVDGRQALSAAAVADAQRTHATTDADRRGIRQVGYSLGWQVLMHGDDTAYSHGGGFAGFAAHVSFIPRHRIGVAVLANESALGGALVDLVARRVYAQVLGEASAWEWPEGIERQVAQARQGIAADRERRASRSQTLPFPLDAYVGVYHDPAYGDIELRVVDGRLEARAGVARSDVEVFDAERNQLRVALTGSGSVATVLMEAGRAVALEFAGRMFRRR
jgi:CubicO group peptidase (beta-lactamase class C family)